MLALLTLVLTLPPLAAPCAPGIGNFTGNGVPISATDASGPAAKNQLSIENRSYATVTVDTIVPWSENAEDQQAASLPVDTQLRTLQSIYVHGEPKVQSIMESLSGNGTRIVSQIGWNGNESQLRDALEEAFKYNELMAKFDVAMVTEK